MVLFTREKVTKGNVIRLFNNVRAFYCFFFFFPPSRKCLPKVISLALMLEQGKLNELHVINLFDTKKLVPLVLLLLIFKVNL